MVVETTAVSSVSVATPEAIESLLENIASWRCVVLDCETTGLNPYFEDKILGLGIGDIDASSYYYIPFRHEDVANIAPEAKAKLWKLLATKALMGYNIKFDLHAISEDGFEYQDAPLFDVLVMARIASPDERPELSLKTQALMLLKYEQPEELGATSKALKARKWQQVSCEQVAAYCCADVMLAQRLYLYFKESLAASQLSLFSLEVKLTRVLFLSERRGLRYDHEYLDSLAVSLAKAREELLIQIQTEVENDSFNPRSSKQLAKLMSNRGVEPIAFTPKGNPSWDQFTLFLSRDPVARKTSKYKALGGITEAWVTLLKLYEQARVDEVHASYQNWGTGTGRLSCVDPNMQNIPKGWLQLDKEPELSDTEIEVLKKQYRESKTPLFFRWDPEGSEREISLRRLFIPREGYVFVDIDYRQIELFFLGFYMKDPVFQGMLASEDAHGAIATEIWGAPKTSPEFPAYRKRAKTLNFGLVYGLGIKRLASQLLISETQAKKYRDQYFSKITGYWPFVHAVESALERDGFITNMFGRRYYLPPELAYKGVNYLVQGSAGDFVKFRMNAIEPLCRARDIHILHNAHDEILLEAPRPQLGNLSEIFKMLSQGPFGVELPIEIKIGEHNFVELKEWSY